MAYRPSSTQLQAVEQLPGEITLDIMSRLPAESVIRCKSVCRSWHSLLHLNNHFSRLHLQRQKHQISSRSNQFDFLIRFHPDKYTTRVHELEFLEYIDQVDGDENQVVDNIKDDENDDADGHWTLLGNNYRVRRVGDHPLMIDDHYHQKYISPKPFQATISTRKKLIDVSIQAVGSCNGLVCVSCFDDPTYICNPVTREYLNLPIHSRYYVGGIHKKTAHTSYIVSGFGYHPSNPEEYKVVRIFYKKNRDCKGQVEVYTVGKDDGLWRHKREISYVLDASQRSVLVNGTLYWMSTGKDDGMADQLGIVAFDLAEEDFYMAKVPLEWSSHYQGTSRIRELGGCLSLINSVTPESTDIWMMKDCTRGNESWVKECSIPAQWSICDPFAITKGGEILAWYDNENNDQGVCFARYNPRTGRNVKPYVDESNAAVARNISYGAVAHIKSFISLEDLGEEDVRRVRWHEKAPKVNMPHKRKAPPDFNINDLMQVFGMGR